MINGVCVVMFVGSVSRSSNWSMARSTLAVCNWHWAELHPRRLSGGAGGEQCAIASMGLYARVESWRWMSTMYLAVSVTNFTLAESGRTSGWPCWL